MSLPLIKLADITLGAPTTAVDFTGLNITKNDELVVIVTLKSAASALALGCYANDNLTESDYYFQRFRGDHLVTDAIRNPGPLLNSTSPAEETFLFARISLNEADYLVTQADVNRDANSTTLKQDQYVSTSTFTLPTGITKLTFKDSQGDTLSTGTRIKIYKLATVEQVTNITVPSDTTQLDITGLSLTKDNQLLLVSDVENGTGGDADYSLFVNADNTDTNYYSQKLHVDGAVITPARTNSAQYMSVPTLTRTKCYTRLRVEQGNYFITDSISVQKVGTANVVLQGNDASKTAVTSSSITQLSIKASAANAIKAGSKFVLYKLI